MDTKTIFLIVAAYFLILGLYKKVKKDKIHINFPDEDINVLFRRIDKVNKLSAYAAIDLGFSILAVTLCLYLKDLGYMGKINFIRVSWLEIYNISLIFTILGGIINISFGAGLIAFLGSVSLIKKSIIDYYDMQGLKKRSEWIDYPEYTGFTKEIYIGRTDNLFKVFYIISTGKFFFYLGSFGLCIAVFTRFFG